MGIAITELTPVERTAFVTQFARALDSRWPRPILGDTLADEIVAKIDYDFQALGVPSSVVCQTALRAKMLDDRGRVDPEGRVHLFERPDQFVPMVCGGLGRLHAIALPSFVKSNDALGVVTEAWSPPDDDRWLAPGELLRAARGLKRHDDFDTPYYFQRANRKLEIRSFLSDPFPRL